MATWSIAVFATIFALFMALFWLLVYPATGGSVWNVLGAALGAGWPIFVIAAVLCFGAYIGSSSTWIARNNRWKKEDRYM